jgi:hypothetical protein
LAAVLAVVFVVAPVVVGVRNDEGIEKSLNSPSVVEKFKKTVGNKAKTSKDETSPLVKQAESFALYLNPPKPKIPKTVKGGKTFTRGPVVTPKFKVVGISYNNNRPESSIVLIDEPGKGLHWVRQSGKIGHLIVDKIKDGVIVLDDRGRTYEMATEQKQELSLLEGKPGVSSIPSKPKDASRVAKSKAGFKSPKPALPALKKPKSGGTRVIGGSPLARKKSVLPRKTFEEAESRKLMEKLREIQRNSNKDGSGLSQEERAEMIEKIISQYKASRSRLTDEEAKKLDMIKEKSK